MATLANLGFATSDRHLRDLLLPFFTHSHCRPQRFGATLEIAVPWEIAKGNKVVRISELMLLSGRGTVKGMLRAPGQPQATPGRLSYKPCLRVWRTVVSSLNKNSPDNRGAINSTTLAAWIKSRPSPDR